MFKIKCLSHKMLVDGLFRSYRYIIFLAGLLTLVLGYQATLLKTDIALDQLIPFRHPYMLNYLQSKDDLRSLENVIRVVVSPRHGDIYTPQFLETFHKISDEVAYTPGVDRANVRSLWTPNVTWSEVTQGGIRLGSIIPIDFDGTTDKIDAVRHNVLRANIVGQLVGIDHQSALIWAPLVDTDTMTGKGLDYQALSQALEYKVRDHFQPQDVDIRITGNAKVMGELIDGFGLMLIFFVSTILLSGGLVYGYIRCWKSTLIVIGCSLLAVIWQLGLAHIVGMTLNPYSILLPFLTFALGVSHALQNVNMLTSLLMGGHEKKTSDPLLLQAHVNDIDHTWAAKQVFKQVWGPGLVALLCNVFGFLVLYNIPIVLLQALGVFATLGVLCVALSKMILLPVLMSRIRPSHQALVSACRNRAFVNRWIISYVSKRSQRRHALFVLFAAFVFASGAWYVSRDVQYGDSQSGAPELHESSRYNQDIAFTNQYYPTSPDILVVMLKTPPGECGAYAVHQLSDKLQASLGELLEVRSTYALNKAVQETLAGLNGGQPKWQATPNNQQMLNGAQRYLSSGLLFNSDCSMQPVLVYLTDHKAATLETVLRSVEVFRQAHPSNDDRVEILPAAGNAGIAAVTNRVLRAYAQSTLWMVYGLIFLLLVCFFRSLRVVVAIVLPLCLTSVVCEAMMVYLGLGIKIATLPVIAMSVGIGVDYGIYFCAQLQRCVHRGDAEPLMNTYASCGTAIVFTALTLSAGVVSWFFSSIKFQMDMGVLLILMLLWNMLGTLVLTPAILRFLSGLQRKI